jgi:rhomboid protease GluP
VFVLALLATALGLAWYLLTPAERARLTEAVVRAAARIRNLVVAWRASLEPFRASLRARTRFVVATPAIAAACVLVFLLAAAAPGPLSNPDTQLAWGASYGPLTTRGEWSRLVSSASIHAGVLALLINVAALVQAGAIVERILGPLAFVVVYVGATAAAGVADLSAAPVAVHEGAAGAISGLYGALLALWICGLRRSPRPIPLRALGWLGPVAFLFWVSSLADGDTAGALAGLAAGSLLSFALGRDAVEAKPSPRRVAATVAAILVAGAAALRAIGPVSDARPALARLVAAESATAARYERAVRRYRDGAMSDAELARLIDRAILGELRAAAAPLRSLDGVPPEHRPLVAAAERYIELRDRSWRVRAGALRRSSFALLREADRLERAALEALAVLEPLRASAAATGGRGGGRASGPAG